MSVSVPMLGMASLSCASSHHSVYSSCCGTSASSRFWVWVVRTRPKLTRSAIAATASICAALMSPGTAPWALSDTNTAR